MSKHIEAPAAGAHTPEPWIFDAPDSEHEGIIIGRHGGSVVYGDFTEANARRICACVNACATMPTDDLEEMVSVGGNIRNLAEFADHLRQQRDKLMAAMDRIKSTVPPVCGTGFVVDHHSIDGEYLGTGNIDPMMVVQEMQSVAHHAIAEVKGDK